MRVIVQSRGEPVKSALAEEPAAYPLYDEPAVNEEGMPPRCRRSLGRALGTVMYIILSKRGPKLAWNYSFTQGGDGGGLPRRIALLVTGLPPVIGGCARQ
jgi:hypothetical protein